MIIKTAKDAEEIYKSFDEWMLADREAAWKWMFDRGMLAGIDTCKAQCVDFSYRFMAGTKERDVLQRLAGLLEMPPNVK